MPHAAKPITISEVAKRLNLSTVTVSRVINGSPKVSPATRERVIAALREWGFQPNEAARALVRRRSDCVGLMLSGDDALPFSSWYQAEYLRGITQEAAKHDYNLLIYARRDRAERPADPIAAVRARQVEGFLLLGTATGYTHVERLQAESIPYVLLGLPAPGQTSNCVYYDNLQGMYDATVHLINLGHRRIALLHTRSAPQDQLRRQGYEAAMAAAGLPPIIWEFTSRDPQEIGRLAKLQAKQQAVTAVVVPRQLIAAYLTRELAQAGIAVPEQVSVITFDDTPATSLALPALSTVRQPLRDMGALAMRLLVQMIETGNCTCANQILPTSLVLRASTGPPLADRSIAQ